jgi:hypothetical protein
MAMEKRKYLLAFALLCFVISAVIRIDTSIVRLIFSIEDSSDKFIRLIASLFGASGGILVAVYYLLGFLQKSISKNKGIENEN